MGVQELKKKEMEDLDRELADLGIDVNENAKNADPSSKKKNRKNREKRSTAGTEETITQTVTEESVTEEAAEDDGAALTPGQIRSKLEKSKSVKKRNSSKKCVEIAAAEAKARNKGKKGKKDSVHYNQVKCETEWGCVCESVM